MLCSRQGPVSSPSCAQRARNHLRSPPHAGFTLIELLLAFSILGLVTAAAFSMLSTGLTLWSAGQEGIEQSRERHLMLELLRAQLGPALPLAWRVEDGNRLAFRGSAESLEFVSSSSLVRPDTIPRWVRWVRRLRPPGEGGAVGRRFVIEERRILPPDNAPEAVAYGETVLEGLESLEIRYLLRGIGGRDARWLTDWDPEVQSELPAAIRLAVGFEDGGRHELLVPIEYAASNWAGWVLE